MKLFATITGLLGEYIAKFTSGACWVSFLDEEEMPENLLK